MAARFALPLILHLIPTCIIGAVMVHTWLGHTGILFIMFCMGLGGSALAYAGAMKWAAREQAGPSSLPLFGLMGYLLLNIVLASVIIPLVANVAWLLLVGFYASQLAFTATYVIGLRLVRTSFG